MNPAIRYDPLNWQAEALQDAQTEIKVIIQNGVFEGTPFFILDMKIQRVIKRALAKVRSPTLRQDAVRSLNMFATRIYAKLKEELGYGAAFLAAVYGLATRKLKGREKYRAEQIVYSKAFEAYPYDHTTTTKGIPLQMYSKDYIERKVKPALERLAQENALDPNDYTGRNSLRNLAEMQVRYERHQDEIAELKASGNKLVVCSSHADCSDRCAPYQGRVYSLDGTSGTTRDGRKYVPLEEATQNPRDRYVTKAGRVYQNGLLGFNCRHVLTAYKEGEAIPKVGAEERKKEYAVTKRQREYERDIRTAKDMAAVLGEKFPQDARLWRQRAKKLNEEYKEFSQKNQRAYYPSRTKII